MELNKELFRKTIEGKETELFLLKNKNGMEVALTNYGARIVAMVFADKNGNQVDVVTGFDSISGYQHSSEAYFGAIVGRYANRIARGKFALNGKNYQLNINNTPNHLHGGPLGFHYQVWTREAANNASVKLAHLSKDGEENYPGNLSISVTYALSDHNELIIHYEATTDQDTVINVTSHPFFNLNGQGTGDVMDHQLQINSSHYTPVDDTLIPTGIVPVDQTPFDFRVSHKIGDHIDDDNEQLRYGGGYDHNFVLDGQGLRSVAKAAGDKTGIVLEVVTDQPGMQLYTGNFMNSENRIRYGLTDARRSAFCLETQHFPDSPNQPGFPSTILRTGDVFSSTTVYRLGRVN